MLETKTNCKEHGTGTATRLIWLKPRISRRIQEPSAWLAKSTKILTRKIPNYINFRDAPKNHQLKSQFLDIAAFGHDLRKEIITTYGTTRLFLDLRVTKPCRTCSQGGVCSTMWPLWSYPVRPGHRYIYIYIYKYIYMYIFSIYVSISIL